MNLCDVIPRIHSRNAEVEVIGDANGDLLVIVIQGQFRHFVTNKGNGQIKRFREPRTLTKYLCNLGIRQYSLNLNNWDLKMIFDRHKAASDLRSKQN
ncbi:MULTISPECIES: hypothetical protein [Salinimonas]|uniref:Uncharacterized protein n=2 Tax=Salinimonas TaxID=288793 RepID=A0A5B7YJ79_9ALTE|nr:MULTISPECIES: hypothetical protein [Salinimonas]MBD3587157.1 hypothetical protein [Salinimonas profundi]QCZ95373.1 hypothetical protein FBQ74_17695 [Salinimonas iocasae]